MIEQFRYYNKKKMVVKGSEKKGVLRNLKPYFPLYLFLFPAILTVLAFGYLPMFANIIAFMDYDMLAGWLGLGSKFVGLRWFKSILTDIYFIELIGRTLYYNAVVLILGIPAPFVLALLLNELRNRVFKRIVQTVSYLPWFVSWVTLAALAYLFLSVDNSGLVNNIRQLFVHGDRVIFLKDPNNFPIILTLSNIFKGTGWGSIIYLAAISALDTQLFDAARIDGAGRWKQFVHITFPGILPTTVILLIFAIGSFFSSNFDQIFNLQNNIIREETNVIAVYQFVYGIQDQQYSIAAAVGLFQGGVNAVLLVGANYISRKITQYGLF